MAGKDNRVEKLPTVNDGGVGVGPLPAPSPYKDGMDHGLSYVYNRYVTSQSLFKQTYDSLSVAIKDLKLDASPLVGGQQLQPLIVKGGELVNHGISNGNWAIDQISQVTWRKLSELQERTEHFYGNQQFTRSTNEQLNGAHGEHTGKDDVSPGEVSNSERKRMHKEAITNRHHRGGSNRSNQKSEPLAINATEPVTDVIVRRPLSSDDIYEETWCSYEQPESFFSMVFRPLCQFLVHGPQIEFNHRREERANYVVLQAGRLCMASYIACNVNKITQMFRFTGMQNLMAYGALAYMYSKFSSYVVSVPTLLGLGSLNTTKRLGLSSNYSVNKLGYSSKKTGFVYRSISRKLILEFTGCTVDRACVARALKRANELFALVYDDHYARDHGILADTVAYAMCIVSVELSRASIITRDVVEIPRISWH